MGINSIKAVGGALIAFAPFTLKLVLGDLVFSAHLQRRKGFPFLLLFSFLMQLGISVGLFVLLQGSSYWVLSNTVYYFLLFLLSALSLKLLFRQPLEDLFPCAVGGYLAEHVSSQIFVLAFYRTYLSMRTESIPVGRLLGISLLQMAVFFVSSGLIWLLFARKATVLNQVPELKGRIVWLSVVTLLVVLILSSVRDHYADESFHLMVITRLFSIFASVFLLDIRYDMVEKARLEAERSELRRIMALERKQYELSKENIEIINIKCHDMRHKIDLWQRQGAKADQGEVAQIRQMIDIYDRGVHTGNEVLDTILTEWSLTCEKKGIRMSCMADGEKLGFVSTGDLCALFGNALENAIEAVSQVPEEERNISLQVRENRRMLLITMENSYVGDLNWEEGLPKSSKEDGASHGFGIKSIRSVSEKYGGQMDIQADEIFRLTVVIPLPSSGRVG